MDRDIVIHRRRKLDLSQRAIVAALEAVGCGVADLSGVGAGVPDLLVSLPVAPWDAFLMECKTPKKQRGKAWTLTPAQVKFRARWKGVIVTVETVDEALRAVGVV